MKSLTACFPKSQRMKTLALALACFTGIAALSAPIPKELRQPSDTDLFVGSWSVINRGHGGKQIQSDPPCVLKITSDNIIFYNSDGTISLLAKFRLLADCKDGAKQIDWTVNGLKCLGIYRLNGDNLTLALAIRPTDPRPSDLKSEVDISYITLRRIPNLSPCNSLPNAPK